MPFYSRVILFFLIFISLPIQAQEKYSLSGYVRDSNDGESLFGATIIVRGTEQGAATNAYGFYSLTLPEGNYVLEYRYIGYNTQELNLELNSNQKIDIELISADQVLEEVVVQSIAEDINVTGVEMSVEKLSMKTIQKMPTFLGEADVLKSLQLLPGVSSVGDGAAGFNVRGGSVGQNLVLLDEAPVYNASHLLGFFSVFNPDAVKDVKLYKGGIPPRFGGRIASILDIQMKEGNSKEYSVQGGIGSIFSRIAVEGPMLKEKGSFIIAARRSYIDVLARPFTEVLNDGGALNFYDLTLKTNYRFSDKDRIYLSGYFGRDKFKFDERQGFNWGNTTATIRWNHVYNQRLFMNLTGLYSDYDYELAFGEDDLDKFNWNSRIRTTTLKSDFSFYANTRHEIDFGGEFIYYRFDPANAVGVSSGEVSDISLDPKYSYEASAYLSTIHNVNLRFSMEYGLRFSSYYYTGPGNAYEYEEGIPGERRRVIATERVDDRSIIEDYYNIEPRFNFRYKLSTNSSIKGSYNRMVQYIHLISNTTASNPLDVWTPSTNNLKPELGDQVALGFFRNFKENTFEASIEGYYRKTQNQVEYIDGADLLINEFIEGDLLAGDGRAYGLEFSLRKNKGRLTGWASYTLARTELQVDGINNGNWYPTRYDQTHNVKVSAFYELTDRWSFSGNFVFLTGTPTTFPSTRYTIQGYVVPNNSAEGRNNVRLPSYHRLDLSATLQGKKFKKNGKERKNRDYWVFGVYNLYGRRNPFSIYFTQGDDRPIPGTPIDTKGVQVSIIGSIIPSVSYNFKF